MNQKTYLRAILIALFMMIVTMAATYLNLANAGEAVLTWNNPTQNTDGSAIPASGTGRLVGNRVEWGSCSSANVFGTKIGEQAWTTPRTSYTVADLPPGTYCFRAFASTTYGESGPSGVASKTIAPPLPSPPANLQVASTVAYTVVKQRDRFVMLPVGTVPPDTQCSTSQSVNGYYVVPREAVTFTGSVQPEVVVAQCG